MHILGVDFTSAPKRAKPITCLHANLADGRLIAERLEPLYTLEDFEALLQRSGPWIAGLDFPFGQARRFVEGIGWPQTWQGYVAHVGSLDRAAFREALEAYKAPRAKGDKEHRRKADQAADAISPQKLYGVPVGLMFYEGAPRLLAAGVEIPHMQKGDPERIAVEAYPGVLARNLISDHKYKDDKKAKQTAALLVARQKLFDRLLDEAPSRFGFAVEASRDLCDDRSGDQLDALLCAVQAAWAWQQRERGYGAAQPVDSLEGWIADPSLLRAPPAAASEPLFVRLANWGSDPGLSLSPEATEAARLALLDTLACLLAGREEPTVAELAGVLQRDALPGPVATLRPGFTTDAARAALFHGFVAHVLDFDDYDSPASTHPSASIVPALLALSDLKRVSLGEILTAYAVGYETIIRVGQALGGYEHYARGWHSTSTLGPLGAAAASARLLRLSPAAFAVALATATSSSAGLKLQFGNDVKPLHAGLAARNGLEAALFAEAGLTANPAVTEGPYGFLALYGQPTGDPVPVGAPLALEAYPIIRKPWPSCAYTHRTIEAALALAAAPGFSADAIVSGSIAIPDPYHRVASFGLPASPPEARFSLPYCAARALLEGCLLPEHFTAEAVQEPRVRALTGRIGVAPYQATSDLADMNAEAPDSLTLQLADGSTLSHSVADVKGGPRQAMTAEEVAAKYRACGGSADFAERLLAFPLDRTWRFADEAARV